MLDRAALSHASFRSMSRSFGNEQGDEEFDLTEMAELSSEKASITN